MLCSERWYPKENTVAHLKSNILPLPKAFGLQKIFGLATPLSHCIAASPVKNVWGQQSRAEERINYHNLKWTFEDLLPCYSYTTKSNSRTMR